MDIQEQPITTLEDAKRYYLAMGCSSFHLARENFQRRDEYYAFGISREMEDKWRREDFDRCFAKVEEIEPAKIGMHYNNLYSLIRDEIYNIEYMLHLATHILDYISCDQIQFVLIAIIGNNGSMSHGGLIEKSYKLDQFNLSQQFAETAKRFIEKAEKENVSLLFLWGNYVDVVETLGLKEDSVYLDILRQRESVARLEYYQKGAERGNIFSMRMLANHYVNGIACEPDKEKAIFWLTEASKSGNALARKELAELIV